MTTQKQLRKERLKAGAATAGIMGLFMMIVQNFPIWWPIVEGLFQNSQEEVTPIQIDRLQSPDICKVEQNGTGNSMENVNVCSPQSSYQYNQTYTNNYDTDVDTDISINTKVSNPSTTIWESTSLSYHSAVNSWLVSKGLLAVMPYIGISQGDSYLSANVFLSNEAFLGKKVLAKQLAAGLRKDTVEPQLVQALGYNPKELVPEILAFTPEEVEVLPPLNQNGRELNPEPSSVKRNSKYQDCWKADIPTTGSNHCKKGDHLF